VPDLDTISSVKLPGKGGHKVELIVVVAILGIALWFVDRVYQRVGRPAGDATPVVEAIDKLTDTQRQWNVEQRAWNEATVDAFKLGTQERRESAIILRDIETTVERIEDDVTDLHRGVAP
jgi:hypothetical protein